MMKSYEVRGIGVERWEISRQMGNEFFLLSLAHFAYISSHGRVAYTKGSGSIMSGLELSVCEDATLGFNFFSEFLSEG